MTNATIKVSIKSVSYFPVKTSLKKTEEHTYVTYTVEGKWGDIELEYATEDPKQIIEAILEKEQKAVKSALISDYEVEL